MSPRKEPAADTIGALSLRGWAAEAEAAAGIAKALAGTAFVPDHLRVWTNPAERDPAKRVLDYENTVAQVTAVLLAGQELEFGPMASLRAFVIIRGTVALYAIAARALLQRHGHEIVVVESNSSRAIVRGLRAGSDHWQESTWDLDRAKTAGLYPGHVDGNWRKQTKAMLVARATAEVARWVASDAMLGLPLIAEEVEDAEVEISPDGDGAAPATPAAPTNRRRGGPRAMLPVSAGLVSPAPPPPPPPPEGSSSQPPPGVPRATKAMIAKLHAGLKALQITGPDEGLALVSMWAGRKIDNTQHLTRDEIRVALERIDALREAARADHADADVPGPRSPGDDEPAGTEHPDDDERKEEPPDDAPEHD